MSVLDLPTALFPDDNPLLRAVADRWPGPPTSEVDRLARLLIASWERTEGTPVTASRLATFVDMGRAIVSDIASREDWVNAAEGRS